MWLCWRVRFGSRGDSPQAHRKWQGRPKAPALTREAEEDWGREQQRVRGLSQGCRDLKGQISDKRKPRVRRSMPARLEQEPSFLDATLLHKNAAYQATVTGPLQFPSEDKIWWGATCAVPPELLASYDAQVVVMKKTY